MSLRAFAGLSLTTEPPYQRGGPRGYRGPADRSARARTGWSTVMASFAMLPARTEVPLSRDGRKAGIHVEAEWLITDVAFNAALGLQVRQAREAAHLTRPELVALLPFKITVATLLNWELGHRSISYARLVELARALQRTAPDLMRAAIESVESVETMFVDLDLRPLCDDMGPRFEVLRLWAKNKLATIDQDARGIARVHHTVVRELAVLLNLHVSVLVEHLTTTAGLVKINVNPVNHARRE